MFRLVPPPIIRSANNCIYSIWYLSHRYCYLPLSGAQTTVSTASGICHTITAACRYQERKQLYVQHLVFVTPLLLPTAIAAGNNNDWFSKILKYKLYKNFSSGSRGFQWGGKNWTDKFTYRRTDRHDKTKSLSAILGMRLNMSSWAR